jgi:hypothetical protein
MSSMQPETAEPGRMQRFVAALLRHQDALAEPIEPEGLEVLAPPPVQQALGIGELARLGFGSTLPPAAQRVGIEGDWLDRFARLLGTQGRWMRQVVSTDTKAPGDPERALAHELVLDNATFRLQDVTAAWTRYLVMDFRASAVSDDKRDLIVRLGVNLATGSLPDAVVMALNSTLHDRPSDPGEGDQPSPPQAALPSLWDHVRLEALMNRALPPRLQAALNPFMTGMRRRLGRDQDRLYRYHNDLYHEAMRRSIVLPDGDPKRLRETQRAEAIRREYRAKLDDLERQYATRVTIEWVQTLELAMPVHRFIVQIRRRKADRIIALDWNPVARRLEPPVCEATFGMELPRLACDDQLHLVVPAGLAPCVNCGRPFCRACYGGQCPKCGTDGQMP